MKNEICELLGIKYPIFQGAMTNVTDPGLVSAVSNAGGLGIYAPGIENVDMDKVRKDIREIKEKTENPFGVNLMLASDSIDKIVQVVCEEKVPVVTTGAGNPAKYMEVLKENQVKVIPVVSTVRAAVKMENAGADALVVSGMEGGGYIGNISTLPLIPQVVDKVKIPVLAAGGFADGRGLAAAMMLGAQGIQMGTRFLATKECMIPEWCKTALIDSDSNGATVLGNRIGAKAKLRVLNTACIAAIASYEESENADMAAFNQKITDARNVKYDHGIDGTLIGLGQSVGLVGDCPSVKELIDSIVEQYNSIQKKNL